MVELIIALYFLPTFLAVIFRHEETIPILLTNLFVGWTIVWWLACLGWALNQYLEEEKDEGD